jgi:hypothetical protein
MEIVGGLGGSQAAPDVRRLPYHGSHAEGLALTTYSADDGPRDESDLLELLIREDGGIRLTCGRGTDAFSRQDLPVGKPPMAVIPILVLELAYTVAALAGRLADQYGAYQGQWRLGLRMDRLRDAVPLDRLQYQARGPAGNRYTRDEYEHVTSSSTEQLVSAPEVVAERLVTRLLRALGVAGRYLPYKPR